MSVVSVAVCGALSSTVQTSVLTRVNRESMTALDSAHATLEAMQATAFSDIFATFNADPDDDPSGAGTAPGSGFVVPGLDAQAGDADGFCGAIVFPSEPQLREDVVMPALGMPRDLDADGAIDSADHAGDYLILPVIVRVAWTGASGNRDIELQTVLCARN